MLLNDGSIIYHTVLISSSTNRSVFVCSIFLCHHWRPMQVWYCVSKCHLFFHVFFIFYFQCIQRVQLDTTCSVNLFEPNYRNGSSSVFVCGGGWMGVGTILRKLSGWDITYVIMPFPIFLTKGIIFIASNNYPLY